MAPPRLATYTVNGAQRYGAVTDAGIVDLSARFGKGVSDAARSHRRRRADETRRGCRAAFAGPCARCDHLAAADPLAGKDHLHRRQLSGPQRRIQGRPGRAEISEHVHAHAALLCRPQHAAGPPARLGAARLRGRAGADHRQGRPAHRGERRARSHRRRHAVQRGHHPRLGAARQVQRDAGQEFRFHRQPRAMARALHR